MLSLCDRLGIPLAHEKIEDRSTSLVFLGILLDSTSMEAKLPEDKLARSVNYRPGHAGNPAQRKN